MKPERLFAIAIFGLIGTVFTVLACTAVYGAFATGNQTFVPMAGLFAIFAASSFTASALCSA